MTVTSGFWVSKNSLGAWWLFVAFRTPRLTTWITVSALAQPAPV
jgi:hypothetical protein